MNERLFVVLFGIYVAPVWPAGPTKVKWEYGKDQQGTDAWNSAHPDCAGTRQSPVAFWREDVVVDPTLPDLIFIDYTVPIERETIHNTGYTISVDLTDQVHRPRIEGANLPDWYQLKQFHFHWGKNNSEGSEHKIGDEHFPLEIHLVHTRQGRKISDAIKDPSGLAVIGVKYQETPQNNDELEKIVMHLHEAQYNGIDADLSESLNVSQFLPEGSWTNFYRYQGSLTTPPCSESVEWIVFSEMNHVSPRQMDSFRQLFLSSANDDAPVPMLQTFRPIQPLLNRTIYTRTRLYLPSREKMEGTQQKAVSDGTFNSNPSRNDKQQADQRTGAAARRTHFVTVLWLASSLYWLLS